ncbi:Uncharacterised protein [Anaerotruncus sp. 2789STDY5834896]|uniref:Uncharacterized protein n=1 Tax=uncultured Anaerotruncus sp. TaxID=905011 RepID=A0A1C6HLM7_9FIRM|nr:Uncharacterised protein [uncultured Anaerotruncus sp.]
MGLEVNVNSEQNIASFTTIVNNVKYVTEAAKTVSGEVDKLKTSTKALETIAGGVSGVTAEIAKGWVDAATAVSEYDAMMAESTTAMNVGLKMMSMSFSLLIPQIAAATTAQEVFNAVTSMSPFGAISAAIGLVLTVLGAFAVSSTEATVKTDALTEKIYEQRDAMDQLAATRSEKISDDLAEISHVQKLWQELQTLTDEQGNVNAGREERAQFLVEEINKLLPGSVQWLNEEKTALQANGDAIDKLIEKKKAEAILDAYYEEYTEAIKTRQQKVENCSEAYAKYVAAQEAVKKAEEAVLDAQAKGLDASALIDTCEQKRDTLKDASKAYEEAEKQVADSTQKINGYEQMQAAVLAGNTDEIKRINADKGASYMTVAETTTTGLREQYKEEEAQYKSLLEMKKAGNTSITDEDVEAARMRVERTGAAMAMAAANQAPYVQKAMSDMGQAGVDGINESTGNVKEAVEDQVEETANTFALKEGETLPQIYLNGVKVSDSYIQGQKDKEGEIESAASDQADKTVNTFALKEGETLPQMYLNGVKVSDSYIKGQKDKEGEVEGAASDQVDKTVNAFALKEGETLPQMYLNGVKVSDSYIKGQKDKEGEVEGAASDQVDKTVNAFALKEGETLPQMYLNGVKVSDSYVQGQKDQSGEVEGAAANQVNLTLDETIKKQNLLQSKMYGSGGKMSEEYIRAQKEKEGDARRAAESLVTSGYSSMESKVNSSNTSSLGYRLGSGLSSGISNAIPGAVMAMGSMIDRVIAKAKQQADIHSPSRKMRDLVGKPLGQGLEVGMETTLPLIEREMSEEVSSLVARMRGTVQAETSALSARVSAASLQTSAVTAADTQQTAGGRRPLQLHLYEDGQEMAVKLMPYIEKLGGYRACLP